MRTSERTKRGKGQLSAAWGSESPAAGMPAAHQQRKSWTGDPEQVRQNDVSR